MSCQQTSQELREKIKKRFKGNFLREAIRGSKNYICQEFRPADYSAAMATINTSKPIRCGRQMRPAYLRSASELQAAYRSEPNRLCGLHWSMWWGVFRPSGPDAELVGYIQLKRYGDVALYSTILGHGECLGDGIMPHLHLGVMEWILNYKEIKWLMYAGWHDGGKGLNLWKRKAGFDPVMFFSK